MREFCVRLLGVEVFAVTLGAPAYGEPQADTAVIPPLSVYTQLEPFGFTADYGEDE